MAKFKVQGDKLIRVDNAPFPKENRIQGETAGDELEPLDVQDGTLTRITVEDGEVIFEVVGRIE